MELNIIIGMACGVAGLLISYLAFKRDTNKCAKEEVTEDVSKKIELDTKINLLLNNSTETKSDIRTINNKFDNFKDAFSERLTRVEESSKQAHKRLDRVEKR